MGILFLISQFGFTYPKTKIDEYLLFLACFQYQENQDKLLQDYDRYDLPELDKSINDQGLLLTNILPDSLENSSSDSLSLKDSIIDSNNIFITDSLDSALNVIDTIKVDSAKIDSTARLKHFKFSRNENLFPEIHQGKQSSFFANPPSIAVNRVVEIDSTGEYVIIKELSGTFNRKITLKIPIEEYIQLMLIERSRDSWEKLAYQYELKDTKKDLGSLISDITNIFIPLPSSPILSIFGKPGINLKINGAVDIRGAWRSETTEGLTASRLGNTRNEPDFKQTVQINVNGTIGDKLTISADWNTERDFEYQNQLKIKYTGYEDEIVKSVEAGNVSLQTSPLVGGSEALFGVKAQFQLGPLNLTALASQKKGESQEVAVSGGAKSQVFEVHAYDYSTNHYFLHQIYADTSPEYNFFNKFYGNPTPIIDANVNFWRVKELEVWKTTTGLSSPNERKGNAYIDLRSRSKNDPLYDDLRVDTTGNSIPGRTEIGRRFIRLSQNSDYTLNNETGYISFRTQIQEQDALGVSFRIEGPTNSPEDDLFFGEFLNQVAADSSLRIILRLVKPQNLLPQFDDAWVLQLRNIYPINGRDIKEEGFKLDVNYLRDGGDPVRDINGINLLNAFGLDVSDASGTSSNPDGEFDFRPNRTIIPQTGEIIFPTLQPFGKNFPTSLPADSLAYYLVYDTLKTFAKQDRAKDKFIIKGEYSAASTSVYSIGFNVVENSVRVTLNGADLKEGIDYAVDYNIGQVTIRNSAALVPGANLKITYEQNDLFQLASKTLLGLRGIFDFSKKTKLGFSALSLNQQTLSDKVRIGEEPLNNSIYGLDFQTSIDMPFMTKALDNIFSTKEMSSLSVKGEFAYMNPDPNTKKSTITSDGGNSIAYIDDFEGSKRIIPVGVAYTSWKDLSVPNNLPIIGELTPLDQMAFKGNSYWYNVLPSDVFIYDIYGDRKTAAREDEQITVLDIVYDPKIRGTYNYNPNLTNPRNNWGGLMKVLSSTASNLEEENIEFIEFWLNIDNGNISQDAKLFIDIGKISEDVIPNNFLNTEDLNLNDLVEQGEDIGIDALIDFEEPGYDAANNPDPSGDNFSFNLSQQDYTKINGTQGNAALTDIGNFPDTEDLNRNFTLDQVNSYFRYEIPIDTNKITNPLITGGGDNAGWYQFRIPLKDFVEKIGDPSFQVVEFIRVYFNGVNDKVHIRLAEFNLVGNQWQKVLVPNVVTKEDTVLSISVINIEDNPEYVSPGGVQRERDRTKPEQEIFKNEQSLNLIINGLEDGQKREIVKYLFKPLDVFNYREMKFFVHPDENDFPGSISEYTDENNYATEIFFKFGTDTLNYYEFRKPLEKGPISDNFWSEVTILFSELTAIKQRRNPDSTTTVFRIPILDSPGHSYGIRGNPSLTKVTFFIIGIENPKDKGVTNRVSGNVWVNELRVLGADDSKGWAYTGSTSLKIADLFTANFNMSQTNPYFHRLSERFGDRIDNVNWSASIDFDLLKLIPFNLSGSNLRVNYSRTESIKKPLYLPGTDIKVDEASAQLEQRLIDEGISPEEAANQSNKLISDSYTLSVSDVWSLSNIKLKIPTDFWLIRDTFNSLTFTFNYNKSDGRSPTTATNRRWGWNAGVNYNLNMGADNFFYPADIPLIGLIVELFTDYRNAKVYYLPQSLNASLTSKRSFSYSQTRTENIKPVVQRDFSSARSGNLAWKLTEGGLLNLAISYNASATSSLAYLLVNEFGEDRSEKDIWNDLFRSGFFGRDINYTQSLDLKMTPRLPTLWDINKFINITAGYNASYTWQNNLQQEELGRGAGFSNRINASFTLRLQQLFAPLFADGKEKDKKTGQTTGTNLKVGNSGRAKAFERNLDMEFGDINKNNQNNQSLLTKNEEIKDSVKLLDTESVSIFTKGLMFLKETIKYIFFDYESINFNFSQDNSFSGSGLQGTGTGFNNFFGVKQDYNNGPSRGFMVGLEYDLGPRARNANLTESFQQRNTIEFRTSRPLWEGAKIEINWKVGWNLNKSTSLSTDSIGTISINNITSTGSLERSFISFPPTLIFSSLNNGIKKVSELYDKNSENRSTSLSNAFLEGFESLPLLKNIPFLKEFSKYIPRPNWRINWDGLEKFLFFDSFANKVTLSHAYTSSYIEGTKINPDGLQEISSQKISFGFNPLVGLNITFLPLFDGNLSGNLKYSATTNYDLGASTRNITETFTKDIGFTATYSKSGFELPLFGLSLKNDLEISLSYTSGKNSIVRFDMDNFTEDGKPQDGTTRTTIEPRIRYVMSARVTLALFYKRISVEPEGASRIPPTTTNEAGLEVSIKIQ